MTTLEHEINNIWPRIFLYFLSQLQWSDVYDLKKLKFPS